LGLYASALAAANTLSRVAVETLEEGFPFRANEADAVETPALAATSFIVTRPEEVRRSGLT
jgi:hypothetical protein